MCNEINTNNNSHETRIDSKQLKIIPLSSLHLQITKNDGKIGNQTQMDWYDSIHAQNTARDHFTRKGNNVGAQRVGTELLSS